MQSDLSSTQAARIVLAGRILLVALFVFSGATKLFDVSGTAAHIQSKGLPAPAALAATAGLVEALCGLMVIIGWRTRIALIALILFTCAATIMFHDFWNYAGREMINQMLHAFKNVAMIGGMLVLFGVGPGNISAER
jgi:putative oxidoreductase